MVIKKMKPIREQVYDGLKDMIFSGKISSGERIVEVDFSEKLGVSRTPLREALRMLELEGFVSCSEKGGVIVNYISVQDIEEIYLIREALECIVIKEVIKKYSENMAAVDNILTKTASLIENKAPYEEIIAMFEKFNQTLYNISRLKHVSKLINNMKEYSKRFRLLCLQDETRLKEAFDEHCKLVEIIKKKDIDEALKLNKIHLKKSMNFVLEKMTELK
ncbi:GntR family transcriptional regulator [Treponema pedis]|uniref:GntR family transcriptional regulator n=1 Tax=Treponema pedis TaxID=409322 RepID=UPI0003F93779|nr:GntR family transcriptional regulator [Treponema pedis]QSI04332.1 GntR family transcriptional regulator [Treponema pedis]